MISWRLASWTSPKFRANLGNLSRAGFWLSADVYDALQEAERITLPELGRGESGARPTMREK